MELLASGGMALLASLHLALVGQATFGPLLALHLRWRGSRHAGLPAQELAARITRVSVHAFWGVVLTGVLMLGLYFRPGSSAESLHPILQGLKVLPHRRLVFGVIELAFTWACLELALWGWRRWRAGWVYLLLVLAATNLLWHFPVLFTAMRVAAGRPELWGRELSYHETLALFAQAETLARVFHSLAGALVAAAAISTWLLLPPRCESADAGELPAQSETPPAYRFSLSWGRMALAAGLLQLPLGVWLLMVLPEASQRGLMGGQLAATAAWGTGLVLALPLWHVQATWALGQVNRPTLRRCLFLLGVVMWLMLLADHLNR